MRDDGKRTFEKKSNASEDFVDKPEERERKREGRDCKTAKTE